jgi:16S rRNA (guanine1516-N2)-methyltransferase
MLCIWTTHRHGIMINFSSPDFQRKRASKARDIPLIRAVGLAKQNELTILDTCGGLGQDAALMASFGGQITVCERNSDLYTALQSAFATAKNLYRWGPAITLLHEDAQHYLQQLEADQFPDVIYIDPMYPHGPKNQRNKAAMRTLRELVGDDADADGLLQHAWGKAQQRIVVKRPKQAPLLNDQTPSFQYKGSSTRFDIYLASLWA